jgi:hypothetical protein
MARVELQARGLGDGRLVSPARHHIKASRLQPVAARRREGGKDSPSCPSAGEIHTVSSTAYCTTSSEWGAATAGSFTSTR